MPARAGGAPRSKREFRPRRTPRRGSRAGSPRAGGADAARHDGALHAGVLQGTMILPSSPTHPGELRHQVGDLSGVRLMRHRDHLDAGVACRPAKRAKAPVPGDQSDALNRSSSPPARPPDRAARSRRRWLVSMRPMSASSPSWRRSAACPRAADRSRRGRGRRLIRHRSAAPEPDHVWARRRARSPTRCKRRDVG